MLKKFVLLNAAFFAPVLVGLVAVEVLARRIPNDYSLKWNALASRCSEVETLVLGNSHAFDGIDTDAIDGCALNMANVSQTLEYDAYLYSVYADKMPKLRRVIIPVSYFSLFGRLSEGAEAWRMKNYRIYWRYGGWWPLTGQSEVLDSTAVAVKRIYGYYGRGASGVSCSATGFSLTYPQNARAADLDGSGAEAARRHTHAHAKEDVVGENVGYLKRILEQCQARGVRTILVFPPAWKTYANNLDAGQLNRTVAISEQLANAYGATYLNMLNDARFAEEDFFDADHLNERGAKKLTSLLMGSAL